TVATGSAMEQDTAGPGLGQSSDHRGTPFPLAFEEGPVVERGSVQLPTIEVLPELDVLHIVQGYLQTHHLCRGIGPGRLCRKRRRPSLLGQVLPLSRSDLLGITLIHDG